MAEVQEPLFNNLFIWLVVLAIPIIPNLWSIWHAMFREFRSDVERLAWIGACVFIPVLGGIAYLIFGRPRAAKPGTFSRQQGPETASDTNAPESATDSRDADHDKDKDKGE